MKKQYFLCFSVNLPNKIIVEVEVNSKRFKEYLDFIQSEYSIQRKYISRNIWLSGKCYKKTVCNVYAIVENSPLIAYSISYKRVPVLDLISNADYGL